VTDHEAGSDGDMQGPEVSSPAILHADEALRKLDGIHLIDRDTPRNKESIGRWATPILSLPSYSGRTSRRRRDGKETSGSRKWKKSRRGERFGTRRRR
jgi:hypothetical protein